MGTRYAIAYLLLALEISEDVVRENVGARLGVEASEERGRRDDTHVGVVEALVGTKRVETTERSAIDQTGGDIFELDQVVNAVGLRSGGGGESSASGEGGDDSSEGLHCVGRVGRNERCGNERWEVERRSGADRLSVGMLMIYRH